MLSAPHAATPTHGGYSAEVDIPSRLIHRAKVTKYVSIGRVLKRLQAQIQLRLDDEIRVSFGGFTPPGSTRSHLGQRTACAQFLLTGLATSQFRSVGFFSS